MATKIDGGLTPLVRERLGGMGWMLQRVETGGTGRGIPDTYWCAPGGTDGWLELKGQSSMGCVHLRPEQVGWLDRHRRLGGRSHVMVRYAHAGGPRRGPATDELWLLRGDPRSIRTVGLLDGAPWIAGRWLGGPAGWRWDAVAAVLLGAP